MYASGKKACRKALGDRAQDRKAACAVSTFGCMSCLWQSVECRDMSKYSPKVVYTGSSLKVRESCTSYYYYD